MVAIAVTAGILFALIVVMRILARRTSRPVSRLVELGTVSRQWLELHRAGDK